MQRESGKDTTLTRQPVHIGSIYICPDCRLKMTRLDWLIHQNRRCGSMVDDATTMMLAVLCVIAVAAAIAAVTL
jgi:hypothetical protein